MQIASNKSVLRELCGLHTDLSNEEIKMLEDIEKSLSITSNLVRADIFIDCLIRNSDTAIVVSEAKPCNNLSLYKNSVVGQLAFRINEPAVLRTLEIGIGSTDLKAITQENIMVKQNTVPIKNNYGKVIAVLIMEKDITEDVNQSMNMEILSETTEQLTQTLRNLKDTESENTVTYDLINDAIIVFDKCGISVYANLNAEELYRKLGYKDKIIGLNFENLVLNEVSFEGITSGKKIGTCDANVGSLSLQIKYGIIKKKNNAHGVIMLIKDITDIKQKEKELILKSVAIREIHHRVKNNLQTIASILRLQSRRIENIEAKNLFYESINRVLSIAATHEILAQNGVDDVDINTILGKIKNNASRHFTEANKTINVELLGDSFKINSDKATSIAIVINELLQNSFKYAFTEVNEGHIEIIIKRGIKYSNISVIDSGKGFDTKLVKKESLGLNIVKSIIKDKLNGHLNIESNEKGTKVVFYFEN